MRLGLGPSRNLLASIASAATYPSSISTVRRAGKTGKGVAYPPWWMPALMGANPWFTTKASLQGAVREYNANPTLATGAYGPIVGWDVSMITDMSSLFRYLRNFNADISSWDTSKVTTMESMFEVRSARALAPNSLESGLPRACRLRRRRPRPPASRRAPRPASHVPLPSTRQHASAFNQPLSFDTSKVTTMQIMFYVRSARALAPNSLESRAFPACMPLAPRRCPTPSRLPARTSPRIAHAPPFDSAVRVGVQPAAEL